MEQICNEWNVFVALTDQEMQDIGIENAKYLHRTIRSAWKAVDAPLIGI